MKHSVIRKQNTIEISIHLNLQPGLSMLECEGKIQQALNQVGVEATAQCLKEFDTDGQPIEVAGMKLTSKGAIEKVYQTPYGECVMGRHVYQGVYGGATYCPLDRNARIVNSTTPKFAQMVAFKYGVLKSTLVQQDLGLNHGRQVSRCYIQDVSAEVATMVEGKRESWNYRDAPLEGEVHTIALGLDGTCMLYCEEGYREAMAGTISLYDGQGKRLHTTYVGAEPEYGKARFYERMEREIAIYQRRYPWARWVGIADGAHDLWDWLQNYVTIEILDYYHASGYLEGAARGLFRRKGERQDWLLESRHDLKEVPGKAEELLKQMERALEHNPMSTPVREQLHKATTYYANNLDRMDYAGYKASHLPIGSGVTEAACKVLIKERMCGSGMKWKQPGAAVIINLRTLILSQGRWEDFWKKFSQYGFLN